MGSSSLSGPCWLCARDILVFVMVETGIAGGKQEEFRLSLLTGLVRYSATADFRRNSSRFCSSFFHSFNRVSSSQVAEACLRICRTNFSTRLASRASGETCKSVLWQLSIKEHQSLNLKVINSSQHQSIFIHEINSISTFIIRSEKYFKVPFCKKSFSIYFCIH